MSVSGSAGMRTPAAIVLGLLSCLVLFLLTGLLTSYTISTGPAVVVAVAALLAGWMVSAYFIRRNAAITSVVLCRGFLLGAVEWLAVFAATRTSPEDYQNLPNSLPAILGEAAIRWLAAAMAIGCLIAFAVTYFCRQNQKPPRRAAFD